MQADIFTNKTALITGAASGIGKALCEAFHEADAQSIVAVDMNLDGAQETADSVNGIAVQANVGNEKDIINVIQKADEHAGGTDIFCSNAGIACGFPQLPSAIATFRNRPLLLVRSTGLFLKRFRNSD